MQPPRAGILGKGVRVVLFLPRGISRLMPLNDKSVRNLVSLPPRGKVDCRSVAKARRMRGKRRYVFIRFYSPHSPLASLRSHSCHLLPRGKALAVNCLRCHFDRSEDSTRTQWSPHDGEPPLASVWGIRVRLFSFFPRGISRLTLEMTTCSFGLFG